MPFSLQLKFGCSNYLVHSALYAFLAHLDSSPSIITTTYLISPLGKRREKRDTHVIMVLKYPRDHAIISIRLAMTDLLQGNNVMLAHELVHILAKHLPNNNSDNNSDNRNTECCDLNNGSFMSLYPTWYRNGTPAPTPPPPPPTRAADSRRPTAQHHLFTACYFFEVAGLRDAADACASFGILHGSTGALGLLWAVGSASKDVMDGA